MRRTTLAIVAIAFGVLVFNSCIFDPKQDDGGGTPPPANFKDLQQRDDILHNLELAYNQRNINQYDKLLDADFIFHFSPLDVSQNHVDFSNWDRSSEIGATANMFNPNFVPQPPAESVSSIDLNITYPEGEDTWNATDPPDPDQYPGEVWYEKTVSYILNVVAGSTTYVSGSPIDASFVIRKAEVDGETFYRVVIWRDLASE